MIELRKATEADIDAILEIIAEGHNESAFVGNYDEWTARHYLKGFMELQHSTLMLAIDGDEILGGVMMAASYEWCLEPIAYVVKFWVRVAGRRTTAARQLMQYIDEFARSWGCTSIYATATAELDKTQQKLFENLFAKHGFADCGATLKKGLYHG